MSLSIEATDRLFSKLIAAYGNDFMRRWEGLNEMAVKACWSHELAGYAGGSDRMLPIKWALENLPEKAPNVIEFRNLCRRAPVPDLPRLEAPKADPERVQAALSKLASLRDACASGARAGCGDGRDWARKIVQRHASGERVNVYPLRMAREALGLEA